MPVLWVYGTSGVGKTTTTWELFQRLSADGVDTGYVDLDQLGMCYGPPTPDRWAPEPADDFGRHRLKARTLNRVVVNFADAGAQCLIVPGVTDPVRGVDGGLVPNAVLTSCRLRVSPGELEQRMLRRGSPVRDYVDSVAYAETLERSLAGEPCVDTTGLTVAEVADEVVERTGWPDLTAPVRRSHPTPEPLPGEVLWLSGPAGIGKSAIGWEVYQQARRLGHRVAYVDLDQIGFRRPVPADDPGNHRLKAANLASVWHEFRAEGARVLVAVGPLDKPEDLAAYDFHGTLYRLVASPRVLAERIERRGRGESPARGLAGDSLVGRPPSYLREVAERSARIVEALDGVGDFAVDTDDRPAAEIAAEILRRTGLTRPHV
jgi:hypothetical protein